MVWRRSCHSLWTPWSTLLTYSCLSYDFEAFLPCSVPNLQSYFFAIQLLFLFWSLFRECLFWKSFFEKMHLFSQKIITFINLCQFMSLWIGFPVISITTSCIWPNWRIKMKTNCNSRPDVRRSSRKCIKLQNSSQYCLKKWSMYCSANELKNLSNG